MSIKANAPSNPSQCKYAGFMHVRTPIFRLEVTSFAGCSRITILDSPENRYTPKKTKHLGKGKLPQVKEYQRFVLIALQAKLLTSQNHPNRFLGKVKVGKTTYYIEIIKALVYNLTAQAKNTFYKNNLNLKVIFDYREI